MPRKVSRLAASAVLAMLLAAALAAPASATGPTTSCNLTSNNNPSNAGESVTFRFFANSDIAPGPPGPSGVVAFFDGLDPIPIHTEPLIPDLEPLGNDHSTLHWTTSSLSPGVHVITAQIIIPNVAAGSTPCPGVLPPSVTQTVNAAASSTAVSSSANPSRFGESTTFTAKVTKSTSGAPAGAVQFQVGGSDVGSAVTLDGAGEATMSTSSLAVGNHPVKAVYTSSAPNVLGSDGTLAGGQTVQAADTTTGVSSSLNPSQNGQSVTFTATVAPVAPGGGTPAGTVQFSDGATALGAPVALGGDGKASLTTSALAVGNHTIGAAYTPASGNYNGSSGSVAQTVDKAKTTLTYTGPASGDFHDVATLTATLTRQHDGSAVAGRTVAFAMAAESCSATTDSSGVASCTVTPQQPAGPYTVASSFAGDSGYEASSDSDPFTVTREQTSLAYTGTTVILKGGTAQAAGQLTEDDGAPPLVGRSVVFTLGSGPGAQSCTGATNAAGVASCAIGSVNQPLGPVPVKAEFAQDAYYLASSATAQTIVFAFPSKGGFAIGDGNAAKGSVATFFGSQWTKANAVSGGAAPSGFDGFVTASGSSPSCGSTVTSTPANSGGPPATVPSYMGTLVTRRVTKSGSTLRAEIPRIVVLQTGAYGPSPGRGGKGTVVATYCGGP